MIFLTIGTHEPFTRLVKAVDEWVEHTGDGTEVFGQITQKGIEDYTPKHFKAVPHLDPAAYQAAFQDADLIVSHAGMGSILTALTSGKPIVVMPRRGHFGETRNDHQYTTVKQLGGRAGLFVAEDENQLADTIETALASLSGLDQAPISDTAQPKLTDALRSFILDK